MLNKIHPPSKRLLIAIIATLSFYIMTNGYRLSNSMFSGDSLLMLHQNDSAWQIALGRFVQPFLVMLRGGIVTPFLISVISIFWLSLSVYLLTDFIESTNILSITLIAAVMVCNSTLLSANATFLHNADFYTFALFLSIWGIWLIKKERLINTIMGVLSLSISLGVYQSYICVAIALVMIHFLFFMLECPTFKATIKKLFKYGLCFIAAAAAYWITWKIFQKIFGIWTADTYNGMASLGDYSDVSLLSAIGSAYNLVFDHFFQPDTFITIPFRGISLSVVWIYILRFCNIALVILFIFTTIRLNLKRHTKVWHRLFQVLTIVLFPLGINFVCIMSKGMVHTLMIYAFCLVYILTIIFAEYLQTNYPKTGNTKFHFPMTIVCFCIIVVCWSNIVYSNQVYLKKDLQEKATHSLMTRIVYEIESFDNYIAGTAPVAFSGSFEDTPYIHDIAEFEELQIYGMEKTSLTYPGTDYAYLKYLLNVNMNLTRISDENETVKQMPLYPAPGSVAYVDGILVIKISD